MQNTIVVAEWMSEERDVDLCQVICGTLGPLCAELSAKDGPIRQPATLKEIQEWSH